MSVKGRIYMSVKERISKRVFQENKARQIFRKTNISYPLKNVRFLWKIWCALFSWNTCFEICPTYICIRKRLSYFTFLLIKSDSQYAGDFVINRFYTTAIFLYLVKTSENLSFSDVSRGYRKRSVVWNRLNCTIVCLLKLCKLIPGRICTNSDVIANKKLRASSEKNKEAQQ